MQDIDNSKAGETKQQQGDSQLGDNSQDTTKERWKQQLEGSKQEVERQKARAEKLEKELLTHSTKLVQDNPDNIKALIEKDPDIADKVASQLSGPKGEEFKNASELLKWLEAQKISPKKSREEELEEKLKKLESRLDDLTKKEVKEQLETRFKGLSEDEAKVAKEKFDKLVGDRKLNEEEVDEYAEMATLYAQKDKLKATSKKKIALAGSTSFNSTSISKPKDSDESGEDLAKALGFTHLYK